MLQHLPTSFGRLLNGVRQVFDDLLINDPQLAAPETLRVTSEAFPDGSPMPFRFTDDGARVSPPIDWSGIPDGTAAIVLVIEDADSPTPKPLVHAIVVDKRQGSVGLAEGAISEPIEASDLVELGRNSLLRRSYLPPDPPPGHGPHRYAFQVFALSDAPEPNTIDGRGAARDAMIGNVIAKGCLIGTYERA